MALTPKHNLNSLPKWAEGRTDDPMSSKEAARKMEKGGRVKQAAQVLRLVRLKPDSTADELAAISSNLDRYQIARRLSDMKGTAVERWYPRKCRVTGRMQATWRVK